MNAEQIMVAAIANNVTIPEYVLDVTLDSLSKEASAGFGLSSMDTPGKTWLYAYEMHNNKRTGLRSSIEKRADAFGILDDIDFSSKIDEPMVKEASAEVSFSEEVTLVNRFGDEQHISIRNAADLEKTASYMNDNIRHIPMRARYDAACEMNKIKEANMIVVSPGTEEIIDANSFSNVEIDPAKMAKLVRSILVDGDKPEVSTLKRNVSKRLEMAGAPIISDSDEIANLMQTVENIEMLGGSDSSNPVVTTSRLGDVKPDPVAITINISGDDISEEVIKEKLPEIISAVSQMRKEKVDISSSDFSLSDTEEAVVLKVVNA